MPTSGYQQRRTPSGGAHPDLATHDALGLATDAELTTHAAGPHGGAPADADYLVGTAHAGLSAEIVVGTAPGGELGGTWASPTVDATHSGSTPSAATDTHIADADDAHDASAISILDTAADFTATDVEGALAELQADNEAHVAAADPHTGYVREADANWVDLTDTGETTLHSHPGGGGAPTDADYLVGTAHAGLSAEIVVGTSPGGELGGTWASPTVDATHSGSAHHTQTHDIDGADHNGFPGGTTTFLRADGTFAAPTATAADAFYSPGSFTVVTETGRFAPYRLKLTTTQRITIEGTGRLSIHN